MGGRGGVEKKRGTRKGGKKVALGEENMEIVIKVQQMAVT